MHDSQFITMVLPREMQLDIEVMVDEIPTPYATMLFMVGGVSRRFVPAITLPLPVVWAVQSVSPSRTLLLPVGKAGAMATPTASARRG